MIIRSWGAMMELALLKMWFRQGSDAVVDVCDLAVKEGGKGVAEVLRRWDVVGAGAGVGEFLHDVEDLFPVVHVVVDAFLEGGSLGGPGELVVPLDGVLEGSVGGRCLFLAPFLLEFSASLFVGPEVGGEPGGLSDGVVAGRFIDRGESVGAVVDPLPEAAGSCVDVGSVGWWGEGEGGDQLVIVDLVPAAAGDPLRVVVRGGFFEGEVDAVVVGPVEFSSVAEGDVAGGREDGVERVSGGVGE
ncbi:hypothetical protein NDU88_001952 [Pleurodeles waltl]|uniref:Uncharacterized protein n=1 Tax=Pleurodeles waltl TaxID=8319 RepID=A0AAV7T169_PLEWA|nr:hypothetical protein NDU88_001952 [Pleurodeles waltl]